MNFTTEQKEFIYDLVNKFTYKSKNEIDEMINEMILIKKSSNLISEDLDIHYNDFNKHKEPILGPSKKTSPVIPNFGINDIDVKTIHQCLYCNMDFKDKFDLYEHLQFFHNK